MSEINTPIGGCCELLNEGLQFRLNDTILVLGVRASGKTVFIKNKIYKDLCNDIKELYIISNESTYDDLSEYRYKFNNIHSVYENTTNKLVIVDIPINYYSANKYLEYLIYNHRQFNITLILVASDFSFPLSYVSNIDIVVTNNIYNNKHINNLSNLYFNTIQLSQILSTLHNYEFIISDRRDNIIYKYKTQIYDNFKKFNNQPKYEIPQLDTVKRINSIIDELVKLRNEIKQNN